MTTRTVVSRSRRTETGDSQQFRFTKDMIPRFEGDQGSYIGDYRSSAWDLFEKTPMPTIKDEAWRRTDLRSLAAEKFHMPGFSGNGRM